MEENQIIEQLVAEAVADGRKLVTVRRVSEIDDIPGADKIKVATVDGWKCVVLAHEFQAGDLCVFFEVDSFLPMRDERFQFLEPRASVWRGVRGARLKSMKLRGQLSQGLALPVTSFPEVQERLNAFYNPLTGTIRVMDVDAGTPAEELPLSSVNFTGLLNVMKWEKPMSEEQAAFTEGDFPPFIQKTDQERCQNMGDKIFGTGSFEYEGKRVRLTPVPQDVIDGAGNALLESGRFVQINDKVHAVLGDVEEPARYEVTMKLDGSSMTVYSKAETFDDVHVGVCSRNLELKVDGHEEANYVKQALPLMQFFKDHPEFANYAVQGELMGPGIQGNRENLPTKKFYVYNVYSIVAGEMLTPYERVVFLHRINEAAGEKLVESVPGIAWDATLEELGITDMDSLLKFAEGPSMFHKVREGVVFKEVSGRHQFKAISNTFLLKE